MTKFKTRISRYHAIIMSLLCRYHVVSSFFLRTITKFSIFFLIKMSFITIKTSKVPKMNLDFFAAIVVNNLFNWQSSRISNRVLIKPTLRIKEKIYLIA